MTTRILPMKVLLIDDHPLMLSALTTVISSLSEQVTVLTARNAATARELLMADAELDLVLLDLSLGDARDDFALLTELRSTHPALPVVVVSASDRASDVIRSIDLGAMGFVPKRSNQETLVAALEVVLSGGVYVPPMQLTSVGEAPSLPSAHDPFARSPRPALQEVANSQPYQAHAPLASLGLTPRQTEVLGLLLQGKANKLIARDLNLSVETVKDHVAAVLRALNVGSRTQAVLAVAQMTRQHSLQSQVRKPLL